MLLEIIAGSVYCQQGYAKGELFIVFLRSILRSVELVRSVKLKYEGILSASNVWDM